MTVYVDDMAAPFKRGGRTYTMCHMIADTSAELLAMVVAIGVDPKWIQDAGTSKEHFDIAKTKRTLAIAAGARAITLRELASMVMLRRLEGAMGAPATAVERMQALRACVPRSDEYNAAVAAIKAAGMERRAFVVQVDGVVRSTEPPYNNLTHLPPSYRTMAED